MEKGKRVILDSTGQEDTIIRRQRRCFDFVGIRQKDLEKVLNHFKCTRCKRFVHLEPGTEEVKMCTKGHIFCNDGLCGPRCSHLDETGSCREIVTSQPHPFFFRFYDSPIFQCQFKTMFSCPKILTGYQFGHHEELCIYNPSYTCPYPECPLPTVILPYLIGHLKKCHNTVVMKLDSRTKLFLNLTQRPDQYWTTKEYNLLAVIRGENDLFLSLSMERQGYDLLFRVQLMSLRIPEKLSVHCEIQPNQSSRVQTWAEELSSRVKQSSDEASGQTEGLKMKIHGFQDNSFFFTVSLQDSILKSQIADVKI